MKKHAPGYKIGTSPQRVSLDQKGQIQSPAPDTYFRGSKDANQILSTSKEAGPRWSMGTSQKLEINAKLKESRNVPGPGFYDLPTTVGNVPHYEKAKMKTL